MWTDPYEVRPGGDAVVSTEAWQVLALLLNAAAVLLLTIFVWKVFR